MRRTRALVVVLALLVVTAGCTASRAPAELGTATASEPAGADGTTAAEVPVPDRPSPWGDSALTVAVETPGSDATVTPAVREAAAFWSGNAEPYVGYAADLRVEPNATDPDIVVRFVDAIESCAGAKHPVGCAPIVRSEVKRPAVVEIRAGLDHESTARVLKHELGHALGLTHGDAPLDVMQPQMAVATTPKPNATERAYPWVNRTLDVYVDAEDSADADEVSAEVDRALRYVAAADELPAVTFRRVETGADADVVVRVRDEADPDDCSCFRLRGPDPDRDGAPETYRRLTITLQDVPTDTVGWHVGNWLSYGLGSEDRADRPAAFRRATPSPLPDASERGV